MLVNTARCTHGDVYMGRGIASCVNVLDILEKTGALKTNLLSNHAVSVCDSVSVLFGKGNKIVLHKVKENLGNISYLEAFINIDSKKEDIAAAGERFLITVYWGTRGLHLMRVFTMSTPQRIFSNEPIKKYVNLVFIHVNY